MNEITLGSVCMCVYKASGNAPITSWSIMFDFLLSLTLIVIGLKINLKFRKKLHEEKRNTPLGRKGNVIEPIMRWYLNLVIFYLPYSVCFSWFNTQQIWPSAWFSNCWFLNLLFQPWRVSRFIIAYNSFFVALIRYLYIVHREKANEWDFEKVGKRFQIASIAIPIILEVFRLFTELDTLGLKEGTVFLNCIAMNEGLSSVKNVTLPVPAAVQLSYRFFSPQTVAVGYYIYLFIITLVFTNAIEGYFYMKIFQTMNR